MFLKCFLKFLMFPTTKAAQMKQLWDEKQFLSLRFKFSLPVFLFLLFAWFDPHVFYILVSHIKIRRVNIIIKIRMLDFSSILTLLPFPSSQVCTDGINGAQETELVRNIYRSFLDYCPNDIKSFRRLFGKPKACFSRTKFYFKLPLT